MRISNLLILLWIALVPAAASAQPIEEKRVSFAAGTSGATIRASLKGDQITDYLLGASAGQTMTIDFASSNPAGYFNLMIGSDPAAIHIGSTAGGHFNGVLPGSGDYRIRVYLMRSAARRGETTEYTLTVSIGGKPATPAPAAPDYADGLSGGPDWWQVTGVSAGDTLNVRAGPGAKNAVVGQLANGDRVRNMGCQMNGQTKWCQIEFPGDQPLVGWAAGRYLREAAAPATQAPASHEARGSVPCALAAGQPMGYCPFRVARGSGGTASVWITLPGGGERYLDFRDGQLVGSDPGKSVSHTRNADLNMILVDGAERYEIPDAVLYGG
ncbi:SH3 domain-containing protein [Alloyangia pacifica]|uniref:SH3 domain-containing protein n=1 Tax=Alloyangia pacifica TaxID=311180 RepID=UPI001CD4B2FD|nr:SH3 domain-containing protein [Alloyangia pacifica]MCA0998117.1 SH3 domain-containing protein [Alloyangia pacifica]